MARELSLRCPDHPVGQRTGMGGSDARTLLPAVMPAATYDSNNRLTVWNGRNLIYDPNGNLTGDGLYTDTWNARNELTEVRQGGTVIGAYAYDALGRRYSRTLNGTTTTYLYDGISAVQERVGSTNTDLFGLGVDNDFSRTTGSTTQTYLKDALGSTLALVDGSGNLTTSYTYGPYGQTSQTGAADSNSTGYTGREMDAGNLYYYRARYYNTELHRFISQDPIGLEGGMNWYAYVDGNPISLVDPLGLWGFFMQGGVSADAGALFAGLGGSADIGNLQFSGQGEYHPYYSYGGAAYFMPVHGSAVPDPCYPQRTPGGFKGPAPFFLGAQASTTLAFGFTTANNFDEFRGPARTTTISAWILSLSFSRSATGITNIGIGIGIGAGASISSFNTQTEPRDHRWR